MTVRSHRRPEALWPWLALAGGSTGFWLASLQFGFYQDFLKPRCQSYALTCPTGLLASFAGATLTTVMLAATIASMCLFVRTIIRWRRQQISVAGLVDHGAAWLICSSVGAWLWWLMATHIWWLWT